MSFRRTALVACATLLPAAMPVGAADPPEFERQVKPIFVSHCYKCHGPQKQLSGLRLDDGAAALAGGDSGKAIVPLKAAASPLIERVSSTDDSLRMPPEGEPLAADQIAVLRQWIDAGAKWPGSDTATREQHWSLRPVVRVAPPDAQTDLVSPIDRFIGAKLARHQLSLSPPADRRTLIRRLSYDLLGLPPTPEEVAAFTGDADPLAYEKLVDRLLSSPQHGERWAQHWLDAVRFAESDGFETNKPRASAWPYRDYVVGAINANVPYDRFVREQLAGDALGADAATGFLVGGANDVVKSPDPVLTAQQRADVLHDIVATTGSAFVGLTVGCARCHNHKFDPIPQADYYALTAVFAGVEHGERPRATLPDPARDQRLASLRDRLAELDALLLRYEPQAEAIADETTAARDKRPRPAVHPRVNVERFAPATAKRVRMTVFKTNTISPCIDELEVFTAEARPRNIALASLGTKASASSVYPSSTIHKLEHVNDGQYGNSRSWISNEPGGWVELEFPEPQRIEAVRWGRDREEKYADRLALEYTLEVAGEDGNWTTVATHRDREPFIAGRPFDPAAALRQLGESDLAAATAALAERAQVENEIKSLAAQPMLYAGVFTAAPAATHRLHRGDPLQPREEITAGGLRAIPAAFGDVNADRTRSVPATLTVALTDDQRRRLALARWIVDPANPLASRVIVNRLWQHHFGTGLVATPSDLGAGGERPSHPELLDWLAAELVARDWGLRHIHRLIVTSAAYRQASTIRPDAMAIDAQSRLLWRYPPRRLEAEAIRDSILAASGQLELTMGGPGFLAFEPNDNYVRVYNPKQAFGPADFRRMIYMTRIRMQQDGTFGAFDCPDGGQIAPRRMQSTTPLQALNLLNSPFCTEQAERMAARLRAESGDQIAAQVRRAFALAYQREPVAGEVTASEAVVRDHGLAILCRALLCSNEFLYVD